MTAPKDPSLRCTAKAKRSGKQCQGTAIPGGTVCRVHGGAAPQVKAKAELRLAELVQPAIVRIGRIIADPMASETAVLRAAENVLDRAGYPRAHSLDVEAARDDLYERLRHLADELGEGDDL